MGGKKEKRQHFLASDWNSLAFDNFPNFQIAFTLTITLVFNSLFYHNLLCNNLPLN